MMYQELNQSISRLWFYISARRRNQFKLLTVLMVLASFVEIISIGAILPFLGVLLEPERVFLHPISQPFIEFFNYSQPNDLLLPVTIMFGSAALFAGVIRLLALWASTRLSFAAGADISVSVYQRTLYQPYSVHIARNSSEVIASITSKVNTAIFGVISPLLIFVGVTIMLFIVLIGITLINPYIALSVFSGFGLFYFIIIRLVREKLHTGGEKIARESTQVVKALQEGLGGIRDVLIDGTQSIYCQIYRDADLTLRHARGSNQFISQSPRFGIEAIGLMLITVFIYMYVADGGDIGSQIPLLGLIALSVQRILPLLQQGYGAWSEIKGNRASLKDVLDLLDQPLPESINEKGIHPLKFEKSILLENVSFRYNSTEPHVLQDINLDIDKGERVGFIGTTGSGKSTLLDIIISLLNPVKGSVKIDGIKINDRNRRSWQLHIAHVPQFIFLSDTTIAENIAFGVPKDKINYERVYIAAKQANIYDFISALAKGFDAPLGERGIKFSGGQRQRIGIARALYKQADVIIFDEATSALDNDTEQAIMETINNMDKDLTILMIAHRLTTLKDCTKIVELDNGIVKKIENF
jgi:ATP-binding cassette subfamily B protein